MDRREAPARGRRGLPRLRRRRRLQREGGWRRRASPRRPASTTSSSSGTGTPGRTADATTSSWCPSTGGAAVDLTPGRRRRASLQPRGRGLGRFARRAGGLLLAEGREGRGLEHERRRVRRALRRRSAEAGLRSGRVRRRLRVQPGRQPPRLALAAARRLRGRPLAPRGHEPRDGREADADGVLRPAGRVLRLLARLEDDLLHRGGGRPLRRLLRPLGGRSRSRTVLGGGTFGDLSVLPDGKTLVGDAGLAHPPRRDRPLRRRREGPRARHARQRRLPRRLLPATRGERHLHGRGREERPGLAREAPRLRPREEVPAPRPRPRRAAGRLDRRLDLPLERAGLRERRLRRLHAQPARVDRLGAGVHRRHQPRLGRPGVRGRHEGDRLRRGAPLRRARAAPRPPARPTAAT